jgi:Domain of unknown function (DUF4062)
MEAILAAGHIPAAMEQFTPGDETAWDKIKRWIEQSDCFLLILGGRYGSLEPKSRKGYIQLEYEHALEKGKPFFALVIREDAFRLKVNEQGIDVVDERGNPEKYKKFFKTVTSKHCDFWNDRKDIQLSIMHKLPEWSEREDLVGWVRGNEAVGPQVANEMARLSRENSDLRATLSARQELFHGLDFDGLVSLLRQDNLDFVRVFPVSQSDQEFGTVLTMCGVLSPYDDVSLLSHIFKHTGYVFEIFMDHLSKEDINITYIMYRYEKDIRIPSYYLMSKLLSFGLVTKIVSKLHETPAYRFSLSEMGRIFRNRLLLAGDRDARERLYWNPQTVSQTVPPIPS